ncbi:hypothetical protein [Roseibacillus persicicus]|uniref:hypothetical protein n=1 Tax=Roseibacillus persicicus TaxID=454148 RepID=UPI0028123A07|nr:hypothetical protein [Roseibacillus persicicus]
MGKVRYWYQSEEDELTTVDYFIEVEREEKSVLWGFHPRLPKGMHSKKGDEMGLGSDHSDRRQSFAEFLTAPYQTVSPELKEKLIAEMGEEPGPF